MPHITNLTKNNRKLDDLKREDLPPKFLAISKIGHVLPKTKPYYINIRKI